VGRGREGGRERNILFITMKFQCNKQATNTQVDTYEFGTVNIKTALDVKDELRVRGFPPL
jgi:hypothetical protein